LSTSATSSLLNKNSLLIAKSRFFLTRLITYFSLLLLPVWIPKLLPMHTFFHYLLICLYLMFLFSQWYLFAKEMDYRFKIHVKTNSSMERTLYRVLVGQTFMIFYFSLMGFVPNAIVNHFFWGTWVVLGLYYSWPTRGKIIQESVSTDFSEYKFLDSFEKTTLFLLILTVMISVPFIPLFDSTTVLKLYIDPKSYIHNSFWSYLNLIFFPFQKFPKLLNLAYVLYLYFVSAVILLLSFYSLMRHFVSRRLCLFGVYIITSCWAFSKAMQINFLEILFSAASLAWLWSTFWMLRAGNYRAGLVSGIICALATMYHPAFYFVYWIQVLFLFNLSRDNFTWWYKQQMFRYTTLGGIYAFFLFLTHQDHHLYFDNMGQWFNWYRPYFDNIFSKSFFAIIPVGIVLFIVKRKFILESKIWLNFVGNHRSYDLFLLFILTFALGFMIFPPIFGAYMLLVVATSVCLFPLEHIFSFVQHAKSQRNMIFLSYLILCLLDSNMEGRVKILISQFTKPF
jgi:hypothetical protein